MNKLKSAKLQLVKFLFVLPLAAALLLAFREKQMQHQKALQQSLPFTAMDTVPFPPPPPPPPLPQFRQSNSLPNNIFSVSVDRDIITIKKKNGTVDTYDMNDKAQKSAFVKKYGDLPLPPPPPAPPTPPTPPPVPEAPPAMPNDAGKLNAAAPLIVVDGKVKANGSFSDIDNKDIESISVLKDHTATNKYGGRAKNGVIEITTKKHAVISVTKEAIEEAPIVAHTPLSSAMTDNINPATEVTLTAVANVKPVTEVQVTGNKTPDAAAVTINKSLTVNTVKTDVKAVTVVGHKTVPPTVVNGISISPVPAASNAKGITVSGLNITSNVLYIIDGKESTQADKEKLDPNMIQSVDVLTGAKAEKEYGDKGKNGVIKITTKKSIS